MNPHLLRSALSVCAITLLISLSSCTKDSLADSPTPPNGCNTTAVSFNAVVLPILKQNCSGGCHNGTNPSSGFTLDTYSGVKAKVDQNRLYGSITHLPGFTAMPQGKGRLPDCEISQIKAWIDQGALNN